MNYASFPIRCGLVFGLSFAATFAQAQATAPTACAERTKVIKRLADKYGETLQSLGLHQDNAVLEVYASDNTGTWTILLSRPNGTACLVASGKMWEAEADPLTPAGNPV